jgi:hypothetical protein
MVGGDEVLEAEDLLDGLPHAVEGTGAGIAFVTLHEGCPSPVTHGAGPGIRRQADKHILGAQAEQVVSEGP